jgi:hypothetical protein
MHDGGRERGGGAGRLEHAWRHTESNPFIIKKTILCAEFCVSQTFLSPGRATEKENIEKIAPARLLHL